MDQVSHTNALERDGETAAELPLSKEENSLPTKFVIATIAGGAVLCFVSAFAIAVIPASTNILQNQYLQNLPAYLFLILLMQQVNQLAAYRNDLETPISALEISICGIISFLLQPDPAAHGIIKFWLDPFLLLWMLSFFWFNLRVAPYILSPNNPGSIKSALILALCVNVFAPCAFLYPDILNNSVVLACQYWGLAFLLFVMLKPESKKKVSLKESVGIIRKAGETLLSYRPFAGFERWASQRFGAKSEGTLDERMFFWFVLPVGYIIYTSWFNSTGALSMNTAVLNQVSNVSQQTEHQDNVSIPSQTRTQGGKGYHAETSPFSDPVFLSSSLLLGLSAASGALLFIYINSPTHILLNKLGVRLTCRRMKMRNDSSLFRWAELSSISIQRPRGKTSPLEDQLCFHAKTGKTLKLSLGAIESIEQKEAILHALKQFAASVPRDARVFEALEPPADHSYTELWLQALSAPPNRERLKPLETGATLQDGRYSVLSTLGVGGQGQAYLSNDLKENTQVVLKETILPVFVDVAVRKRSLEQFENEAKILVKLSHPKIVKLSDFFIEDHRAYLVLEHIEGNSLRTLVEKNGPIAEKQACELCLQMCDMLDYLHGLTPPVVHRDFTPDNLILRKDGVLKLIDFNVAKQIETATLGTIVGKHAYMPPEQFRGEAVPQSDIYALGATLFYLLCGEDPEPISASDPKQKNPELNDSLCQLTLTATMLELQERFQNTEQIRELLKKVDNDIAEKLSLDVKVQAGEL